MTESRYIIYGKLSCAFCAMAIDLCKALGLEYIYLDYENKQEILEEYKEFYNHPTVPIILSNNLATGVAQKVGGYQELLFMTEEETSG